jgi:DtxR family transcriptional regulator, Mn-dependent transcriptional regulator
LAWIACDRLCDCRPGLRIKVKSVELFDGSMVVSYDNRQETLSPIACERLLVEKVK